MLLIRKLGAKDYHSVRRIYEEGIQTKMATFETKTPDWSGFDHKFLEHSRLVIEKEGVVCGWATLSAASSRYVYRGVAEVSIYIAADVRGHGVGDRLLKELILTSEQNGIWMLQAVIFAKNKVSIHLHQKNGFRRVGYRERIAQIDGVWTDTILLERRSTIVGK